MDLARNIIAVVCDFDDTLTDDSTTQLLRKYGIDPNEKTSIRRFRQLFLLDDLLRGIL
jgi:hypothetical protein